jgi:predicted AlkP superfamily pyrophosphatase or phosphodiesterase
MEYNMILLIVWDGLRPDMITAERTPYLHRMAGQGVFCRASHAAYPTSTRVNSASLTTGCYPGRHGIADNGRYAPALDPNKPLDFADWRHLQGMADLERERLLTAPTLGEILRANGKQMASAGSGSPGTTYLTNPTVTGPVVNWALAWPAETGREIEQRLGAFLGPDSTSEQRNTFALQAVREVLVPEYRPDVLTLWLTEPDHAQHGHGLGSPQAIATLAELDCQLEHLAAALDRSGEEHTYILLSDHGFTTISQRVDINERLVTAGLKASSDDMSIVCNCNSFYVAEGALDRMGDLVRFLAGEAWIGALFVRDDLLEACRGAMPQSASFGCHARSAALMFGYRWWPRENEYGVRGCSASYSSIAATHGSTSPHEINNSLVAWGKGIKKKTVSPVPAATVDIAPTVLHLLGIKAPNMMQGRVLDEFLADGPLPTELSVSQFVQQATYASAAGPKQQIAQYSVVDGHRYLDWVTLEE